MRTIRHPGPEQAPRVLAEASAPATEYVLDLQPGDDLLLGPAAALEARGVTSAGLRIAGGTLEKIAFVTGIPDPTGYRIATHSPVTVLVEPVTVIAGTVIFGRDETGGARIHCHAVFALASGAAQSGHLIAGSCPVAQWMRLFATPTGRAGFGVAFDVETNFPLFEPTAA